MAGVAPLHGDSGVRGPRFETRHALLSFCFFIFYFFLEIFPSTSFSFSIVAVLVSVRHLEMGVKKNRPRRLKLISFSLFWSTAVMDVHFLAAIYLAPTRPRTLPFTVSTSHYGTSYWRRAHSCPRDMYPLLARHLSYNDKRKQSMFESSTSKMYINGCLCNSRGDLS